jgi:hypothetical protein
MVNYYLQIIKLINSLIGLSLGVVNNNLKYIKPTFIELTNSGLGLINKHKDY